MKRVLINSKTLLGLCVLTALAVIPASAQQGKIRIDHLERLANTAVETIDVTVDEKLILLASKFLNENRSNDEKIAKEVIKDLKGVFVKRFVFEKENEYSGADVEDIRSQLNAPGWSKVVGVRSKRQSANVDVHIMLEESIIRGLAIVVAEPRALTVVNVVGPIDVEKLSQIEGKFGIPKLDLEQMGTKTTTREKKP
ncbi:MAG TPA: DUF4252 domain-containing protein [Blastocatellia bacterium]|nr:DUF4252 domain-containing protein [Blastocatellia bacterium]